MSEDTENPSTEQAEPVAETPVNPDAEAAAAFDQGVQELTQPAEPKAAEPVKADVTPEKVVEPVKELTDEEKAEADRKAALEKEIASLKVTQKTAERFRQLNERAHRADQLEKELEVKRDLAEQAERFNAIIADTQANPQQIGTALRYLKAINSNDKDMMREAFTSMKQEVAWLAKTLGEPLEAVDPVTDHADLNAEIEAGALTPERAREIAKQRADAAREAQQRQARTQQETAQSQREAQVDNAMMQINELNNKLKASDPHFAAKLNTLKENGTIDLIKELPPVRWPAAVAAAFAKLPDPKPAAPVTPMPLRPNGGASAAMKREPKSDLEAFSMGVESLRA